MASVTPEARKQSLHDSDAFSPRISACAVHPPNTCIWMRFERGRLRKDREGLYWRRWRRHSGTSAAARTEALESCQSPAPCDQQGWQRFPGLAALVTRTGAAPSSFKLDVAAHWGRFQMQLQGWSCKSSLLRALDPFVGIVLSKDLPP